MHSVDKKKINNYLGVLFGTELTSVIVPLHRVTSRTDDGLTWDDEAADSSLIQQAPTVYVSELPSTTAAVSSQRLQDFRWTSAVKSEPVLGIYVTA